MTDEELDRINRAEEIQRYTENRCEALEKENAELKKEANHKIDTLCLENAELKKKVENLQSYLDTQNSYRECAETWRKLTKAKDIIRRLINSCCSKGATGKATADAEQFLKEE